MTSAWKEPPGRDDRAEVQHVAPDENQLELFETLPRAVASAANDAIAEEIEEFVACIRNGSKPETDGWWASRNLAVLMAGIQSAREGRAVDVAPLAGLGTFP